MFKMRTSYKKNRPFDFKLIDHVEPNTLLYRRQTGLSNYDMMKAKTEAWARIAEVMECDVNFCLMRWNNLHYQYRKELRRPNGSTWPYFDRLQFLSDPQLRSRAKATSHCPPQQQPQHIELPRQQEDALVDQDPWQSYNDCVVMQVGDIEQHADSTFVIEEIIESNDQMVHEEIIYEEEQLARIESTVETVSPSSADTQIAQLLASPANDYLKMNSILQQLPSNHKRLAERRIMAFALKCQLRALVDESIDDLII
ncbi:uncharacterized protein LOC117566967 isoform X1 [Drosophila albomicans]|uniref:Uncharacterized protein LOC117566967 isoform X1 n=2 Tax=Drosophila albomicans TaxID=7291 RepID=A0A9C6T7N9_DROAB|nr:uncharacterized protein LOC117566967 isoform X1 [Drosophila albomicans]